MKTLFAVAILFIVIIAVVLYYDQGKLNFLTYNKTTSTLTTTTVSEAKSPPSPIYPTNMKVTFINITYSYGLAYYNNIGVYTMTINGQEVTGTSRAVLAVFIQITYEGNSQLNVSPSNFHLVCYYGTPGNYNISTINATFKLIKGLPGIYLHQVTLTKGESTEGNVVFLPFVNANASYMLEYVNNGNVLFRIPIKPNVYLYVFQGIKINNEPGRNLLVIIQSVSPPISASIEPGLSVIKNGTIINITFQIENVCTRYGYELSFYGVFPVFPTNISNPHLLLPPDSVKYLTLRIKVLPNLDYYGPLIINLAFSPVGY
ncbi:hypothetical protein SJAV_27290 [Sulfurisphaera javensis]|uniref:Uncharacterized protein n=1 Tax=Sulfurisphaera javensis TaxID=2049879 RepID=A0AAT9GVD4_9CREN